MRARSLAACARLCQGNQLGRAQRTQSALKTLLRDSQPPTVALSVHATLTGRDGRKGRAAPTCHARQPSCQQAPGVFGSAGPAGPSLASLNTEVACRRCVSAAGTPRPRPRLKRNGPGLLPGRGAAQLSRVYKAGEQQVESGARNAKIPPRLSDVRLSPSHVGLASDARPRARPHGACWESSPGNPSVPPYQMRTARRTSRERG